MFGEEKITRKCLVTLSNGAKVQAELIIPKPKKPMFLEVLEKEFIKRFNESQPNAINKCVAVHIMRN